MATSNSGKKSESKAPTKAPTKSTAATAPVEGKPAKESKAKPKAAASAAALRPGPLGRIFGVRHLSPMGALQLERFIDEVAPTAIVIEGPADADAMIPLLAHKKSKPPLAILSFTQARPVRSIIYPLAAYSPEWMAITKGLARKALVRFMDLPTDVFLAENAAKDDEDRGGAPARSDTQAYLDDPYTAIAAVTGEADHDTWWERHFEHNAQPDAYREAIFEFGAQLREVRKDSGRRERETLLREAYMRRVLREVIAAGHDPDKIVVVCGAYHAPVLTAEEHAMTDEELSALPKSSCTHTIMPYSYPRLSAQSGYGAGNNAPAYYQILFDETRKGRPEHTGYRVLSALAGRLRARGHIRSSAEVIEASRLARTLAALNEHGTAPTLRDLLDGALTCLAYGDRALIESAAAEVVVGDEIGAVAPGVARTSIQEDFYRLMKDLKLEEYLKDKKQPVKGRAKDGKREALDLREDRRAATAASALRDRNVSIFLHRLSALGVKLAELEYSGSDVDLEDEGAPSGAGSRRWSRKQSTFKEAWSAQWTPDCEITLVECALKGDTIEIATVRSLQEKLAAASTVGDAAQVALVAMQCELQEAMNAAVTRVRELGVDDGSFSSIATAVRKLSDLTSYGSVRKVDLLPLEPLVAQLFLRATLLLPTSVRGDDDAARAVGEAMGDLQWVATTSSMAERVENGAPLFDVERWWKSLDGVADDDAAHGFCAGVANALLLERGKVADAVLDRRVALRISPGLEPNAVGNYFEGLASRNRMALLSRKVLWRSMTEFIEALDHDAFKRSVVGLRRAFGAFETGEARRVAELLTEIWGGGREVAAAITGAVESKVDEAELKKLTEDLEGLDDLDL